ncbi:MAG TPA: MltA domain-containing protein, partial [Gammaproteobacteria bacterium]|nr:MltA domain-containing protein [Gammaproteobacteria bacterium]
MSISSTGLPYARPLAVIPILLLMASCAILGPSPKEKPRKPGVGPAVPWTKLPGWNKGRQAGAWPALIATCKRLGGSPPWRGICNEATLYPKPSNAQARFFMRTHFVPHRMLDGGDDNKGLITGYYVPLLNGSFHHTDRYRYPLYKPPSNLLHINLGARFIRLAGERVRGRLTKDHRVVPYYDRAHIEDSDKPLAGERVRGRLTKDHEVVPYYDRAEIEGPDKPLKGDELLWVDNRIDRFFL